MLLYSVIVADPPWSYELRLRRPGLGLYSYR